MPKVKVGGGVSSLSAGFDAASEKVTKGVSTLVPVGTLLPVYKGNAPTSFIRKAVSSMQARARKSEGRKGGALISSRAIGLMSDDEVVIGNIKAVIPTGIPPIDARLRGGLPVGRSVEIFGPESSGKTSLCQEVIYQVTTVLGGFVVFLNFEQSIDKSHLISRGCDMDRILYCTPDHIEMGWAILDDFLDGLRAAHPKCPIVIVWDSIAASPSKAEMEGGLGDVSAVAAQARSLSQGLRRINKALAELDVTLVYVNQEREKMSGGFKGKFGGPQVDTPGGKAVRFYASVRMRLQRIQTVKVGDVPQGQVVKTTFFKCKTSRPFMSAEWYLSYDIGPDAARSLLHDLRKLGLAKVNADSVKVKGFPRLMTTDEFVEDARKPEVSRRWATLIHNHIEEEYRAAAAAVVSTRISNDDD